MKCVFCGAELGKDAPATIKMKNGEKFPLCMECATEKLKQLLIAIGNYMKEKKGVRP